jgi:hypothetical protein
MSKVMKLIKVLKMMNFLGDRRRRKRPVEHARWDAAPVPGT